MNKQEYLAFHQNFCQRMVVLAKKKNADYTGNSDSAFNNVEAGEKLGIGMTEEGILFRMTDKFSRAITFVKTGTYQVEEDVKESLIDLANYAAMLAGVIESKRQTGQQKVNQLELFDLDEFNSLNNIHWSKLSETPSKK